MPCYDPDSSFSSISERTIEPLRKELAQVEAMLCAVIKVLVDDKLIIPIMDKVNAEEAGVTANDIAIWWRDHKVKDAIRKRKEQEDE